MAVADSEAEPADDERDFVKYTMLRLDRDWRRLPKLRRTAQLTEMEGRLTAPAEGLVVRTYSLVGTKADAEMLLWTIAPELETIQDFHARLFGARLGGYLETRYSYLGLGRRSQYLARHAHRGQEGTSGRRRPRDLPYLVVYPFAKRREWYRLSFEERQRIMLEHFRIGHRFPAVQIHTAYSFGLDDAEFVLAFETGSLAAFLDLVEALRSSEASRYTALETPIFTANRVGARRMLELAGGLP